MIDEEMSAEKTQEDVLRAGIALNDEVTLDIPELLQTKLLLQANSGGGKTYFIRRLLEQSHGQLQHIVIDIEGGLRTLREEFEYVILGEPSTGADFPLTPENAAQLAQMFLEFRTSIILHLGGYSPSVRQEIVKNFLESLLTAPEALWHPAFIVVDEAHIFCPQLGTAVASEAVKDLCARGRYRGFCPIVATQRVTKLHNDVLAECNNKFFGRTTLPDDLKRSNEQLNFSPKSKVLEHVVPGRFYGYGPALSPVQSVQEVLIGEVLTTHPTPGSRITVLQPPESMTRVLEALRGLLLPAQPETKSGKSKAAREPKALMPASSLVISSASPPVSRIEVPDVTTLLAENDRLKRLVEQQAFQIQTLLNVTSPEQQRKAERLQAASVNIEYAVIHQLTSGGSTQENIHEKRELAVHLPVEPPKLNEAKFRSVKARFDAIASNEKKVLRVLLMDQEKWFSLRDLALWLQVQETTVTNTYTPRTLLQLGMITRFPGTKTLYRARLRDYLQDEFPEADVDQLIQRLLPQ